MALLNIASDIVTRQTVWVGTKVSNLPKFNGAEWEVTGKAQANSHNRDNFTVDGLSAADLAGMSAHAFRTDARGAQWG
jgi:hypothetical protein